MVSTDWIGAACAAGDDLSKLKIALQRVDFLAATTGAVASKELFQVTGLVKATVVPICVTTSITSGAGATIEYGVDGDTNLFLGAITAVNWDDTEIGINTTPLAYFVTSDTQPNWAILNGVDIGYEVKVDTLTAGRVDWYCLWYPISEGALVEPSGQNAAL